MMRRFAIAIFLLLTSIVSSSQNFNFTPIVRNFSTADYGSSRQNWSLTQGHDGVIYVGNNTCLLEYDNSVWSRHMLPGKELVRAVHFSPDGKIYCGAYHEFGYFEKIDDSLRYNSISALVPELVEDHDEVWNIITDPYTGKVIFQTFSSLFIYDGETVTVVRDLNPLNILKVGNVLYSQVIDGDFVMLQGGQK